MPNRRFAAQLASALADLGVEHACVSPGSRNAPLLAGLAAESRIRKWPLIDERSAGFFALGLAKATGKPVVLACTSGTAATEYHPAIVEASQSDTPLLILTADRPPELRNVGAPQTIDQVSLYGTAVRLFADALPPDDVTDPQAAAEIAIDIWSHAIAEPPGPVHLNMPFREPLLEGDPSQPAPPVAMPSAPEQPETDLTEIASLISGRRGLIIAGQETDQSFPDLCTRLAAVTGFPIFADPLSGLRFGNHAQDHVLGYGDQLAAAGTFDRLEPEVVLRFGPVPTSKPAWSWLANHPEVDQVLIDRQSRDATRSATTVIEMPPVVAARAIANHVTVGAPKSWLADWNSLDTAAGELIRQELKTADFPNEPAVARAVAEMAPTGTILTIGSSMPIRDLDAYAGKRPTPLRVFGNRGANGIDGVLSAALGAAASGANTVALVGDVSLFHDVNALGTAAKLDLPITVVVINNNGGGIFHFLDHSDPGVLEPETFETYLATPHELDFATIAGALGVASYEVEDLATLRALLSTEADHPRLVQVRTERRANRDLHTQLSARVAELIRSQPTG